MAGDRREKEIGDRRDLKIASIMTLTADEEMHLCMVLLVLLLVVYQNSIRERNYLLRQAIVDPKMSPWQHLMDYGDSSSFLLMTGLNCEAFNLLLDELIPPNHC